ncbi:hypothetical protein [Halobellus sp. H-GB7]|uniref:hypothetical protein n=1 Tax=Halobellus sp. H-GB7 TaxID=3069756 RepID=UPI0027B84544|nr:hypothetical protein [Halobellus sp. H-GB7]MDQ2053878.1 hypothetical protein [Halobellus sp. H-GB7]
MRIAGERRIQWRRPEYTGPNRCLACTAVNVALTGVLAVGISFVSVPFGVAVGVVGLAAIYFRGYLVPGTPTLTKRYLPDSVLQLFDGHTPGVTFGAGPSAVVDIERFLGDVGALESCRGGGDLCLSPRFRDAWFEQIDRVNPDDAVELLFEGTVGDQPVSTARRSHAFVAMADSVTVGKWESEAAFLADCAADAVLRDRTAAWRRFTDEARLEVLGALRLWLDRCPACGGVISLDGETVESCCRSFEVVAATCNECGTRVFEARLPPDEIRVE